MAHEELARRLEELDMSQGEAKEYGMLLAEVQAHIVQLLDLLESMYSFVSYILPVLTIVCLRS